jgi:hypothetical protein
LVDNRKRDDLRKKPIVLGSAAQPAVELNPEHWRWRHTPRNYSKQQVVEGEAMNGILLVDIERPGLYSFSLRRWPRELETPIRSSIAGGKALNIAQARLKVGDFDQTQDVTGSAPGGSPPGHSRATL